MIGIAEPVSNLPVRDADCIRELLISPSPAATRRRRWPCALDQVPAQQSSKTQRDVVDSHPDSSEDPQTSSAKLLLLWGRFNQRLELVMSFISVLSPALLYLACAIFYFVLGFLSTPPKPAAVRYCYFAIATANALLASTHF
jgi:hypothetical protein